MHWHQPRAVASLLCVSPPGPITSTPTVHVTLQCCACRLETDTGVLHLWCSPASASSLYGRDSETTDRARRIIFHFPRLAMVTTTSDRGQSYTTWSYRGWLSNNNILKSSVVITGQQYSTCKSDVRVVIIQTYMLLRNQCRNNIIITQAIITSMACNEIIAMFFPCLPTQAQKTAI